MAIGTATCTCSTCGNTFEVRKKCQNRRDADRWENWAEENYTECNACWKARKQRERDEENQQAAESADALGWPQLKGTEKQVAWANTIREKVLGIVSDKLDHALEFERLFDQHVEAVDEHGGDMDYASADTIRAIRDWLLATKVNASDWIDIRDYPASIFKAVWERKWIEAWRLQGKPVGEEEIDEAEAARERENAAATLEPEEQTHDGVVVLNAAKTVITAAYRKNDDFRTMVKSLGYRWNSTQKYWYKKVDVSRDSIKERAAELGNKLLASGFAVRIADPEVREAAVGGNYEPETFRWVDAQDGNFFITWARDDDFYSQAKRLPRAKYVRPGVLVPGTEWSEVQDFARTHGFRFTPVAQELLDRQAGEIVVVKPAAPKNPVYDEHDPGEILGTPADILDDLKEEV